MSLGRVPSRKRGGRLGPPSRYPRDQASYADPENWKYPVHTPHHAMAARRYFNKPRNRDVYNAEEQLFIDTRINRALRGFGIDPGSVVGTGVEVAVRGPVEQKPPAAIENASLDECLLFLLGGSRLRRAKAIEDKELTVLEHDEEQLSAEIRGYTVKIDFRKKTISHDCVDWKRRKHLPPYKKLCKHIGKVLLIVPQGEAETFARDLIANPDSWAVYALGQRERP